MEIKLKKNIKPKLPSKKTMNLYQLEITDNSWQRVVPYAILIIIIVVAFAKFGIFQRLSQLSDLNSQVSTAQIQLNEFNKSLEDYNKIESEYIRYTGNFMLDEEGTLVDRTKIIGLIGSNVSNIGTIKSYSIIGNTVSLEVIVNKLDDVRLIRKQLEAIDWVENITVNTAAKNISSAGGSGVVASIVFGVVYQGDFESSVKAPDVAKTEGGEEGNN